MSLRLYRALLALYPSTFYRSHCDEMMLDFADLAKKYSGRPFRFGCRITFDFVKSLVEEYTRMFFNSGLRRIFVVQGLVLTFLVSVLALMTYIVGQQVLRHDANDPQVQIASDAAGDLEAGAAPQSVLPARSVDIGRSLAPFLIVYDESGTPIAGSGNLHGSAPRPPTGVFNAVRQSKHSTLTWQPEPGVRIASVTYHYSGARPGFVLVGRSLREVEDRESMLFKLVAIGWAGLLALVLGGTLVLVCFCAAPIKSPQREALASQ